MKYLAITSFLFLSLISQAQDDEQYLSEAKSLASSEKYSSADSLINVALEKFPNHHDLMSYKSRINSWQGNLVKADSLADQVLIHFPDDLEAYKIKAMISYWSDQSEKLLRQAQEYMRQYPDEVEFGYYEAYAYYKLGMADKSTQLLKQILAAHTSHQPSIRLLKSIRSNYYSFVDAELAYAHFSSNLNPWQQIRIGYGVSKKMPWNAHLLALKRFDTKGFSLEAEAYPRLTRNSYAFIETSYSPSSFMAKYTAGLEVFQKLANFEISIGSKRFKFDKDEFFLHKASLGYYKKKYFVIYQVLLSHARYTSTYTHVFRMRTYLGSNSYLQGDVISGANVQEYFNPEGTTNILENKSVGIKYATLITENSSLILGIRMRSEEYRPESSRTRMDFQMGLQLKLK